MIGTPTGPPYEPPRSPDFVVRSGDGGETPEASAGRLFAFLAERLAARKP